MSTKHLTYLDSLRGLAALTVVFGHYFLTYDFVHTGRIAVCLFFILSGFVLSQRFLGTAGMKWLIIEAVIKRPFRLLGVVWVTVILGTIISICVQGADISSFACRTWTQYTLDFFISPFATGAEFNVVLWTISWELWGSMLVFGTVFCCGMLPKYLRMVIFIILLTINIHNFYCAFIIGVIIADLHKNFHAPMLIAYRNLIALPLFIGGILVGGYFLKEGSDPVMLQFISNGGRMISALLIFISVMLDTKLFRPCLNWSPINFLGNISYSLYAIHFLLMKTIVETIDTVLNRYLQHDAALCGTMLITLPMIVFAAWIIDKYVDKSGIRLAAKIAQWAVSIITLEIAMRGSKLKLIVVFRFPLTLLRILFSSKRRYSNLINGAMQLCMVRR